MRANIWIVAGIVALIMVNLPDRVMAESESSQDVSEGVEATITGELGFLDVLSHTIQYSRDGTEIDYVDDGGQDVLFRFFRLSADFEFGGRHHAEFLYQPLNLESRVRLRRDLRIDGLTFPEGKAVNMRFKFPFYRASYRYDFLDSQKRELAAGVGLQLRNATIDFTSVEGDLRRTNRNVGPVPLLGVRTHLPIGGNYWFEFDADGMYAPVSYINGDNNEVIGAILDASLRVGHQISPGVDGFLNLRYLGGGSQGDNPDDTGPGDGYSRNWLHFATVSLGFRWGTGG